MALVSGLSGCAPFYLHKDAYEKETAEVKSSVEKLDISTAYKQLGNDAATLAKAEDQSVLNALEARRNLVLVSLIDPGPGLLTGGNETIPATQRLEVLLTTDILQLTPKSTLDLEAHGSHVLAQTFAGVDAAERHVATYIKLLSSAYRKLPAKRPVPPKAYRSCRDIPETQAMASETAVPQPYDPGPDPVENDELIKENNRRIEENNAVLKKLCVARADAWSKLGGLLTALAPAEDQNADPPGLIAAAALWLAETVRKQKEAMKDAEAKSGELEELLKSLASDKDVADFKALEEFIKNNLQGAADLLQVAGWGKLLEFMQCGLLAELRTEVNRANGGADAKPADDAKTSTACEAGKSGIQIGEDGTGNAAVISVAKLLIQFQKNAKTLDVLERVNANILAIADLRHKLDLAKAGADFESNRIVLLHARLHALLDELADARRSKETLGPVLSCAALSFSELVTDGCGAKPAASKQLATFGLTTYVQSWNRGKIPAEVINYRLIQARRTYDITVAGQAANNYKQLVQPLVDALAAYGAGGIPPELIGQLLGNAAIAAGLFGT